MSGVSPLRPRITALSVAWPRPVKASEPNSATSTLATRSIAPVSTSPPTNAPAAFIGPTVCDEDGPTPILNSSKTLIIARPRAAAGFRSGSRRILAQFDRCAAVAAQHEALPFGASRCGRFRPVSFHLCANGGIGCLGRKIPGFRRSTAAVANEREHGEARFSPAMAHRTCLMNSAVT